MTAFDEWTSEFPRRCRHLLDELSCKATLIDREVTLLLAVAAASICIPRDRLAVSTSPEFEFASESEYQAWAATHLKAATADWESLKTIRYGILPSKEGDVESWQAHLHPIREATTVACVIRILRNGLAHGNIRVRSEGPGSQPIISQIVFRSEERDKGHRVTGRYHCMQLSPHQLELLVRTWIEGIIRLKVPRRCIPKLLDAAA